MGWFRKKRHPPHKHKYFVYRSVLHSWTLLFICSDCMDVVRVNRYSLYLEMMGYAPTH